MKRALLAALFMTVLSATSFSQSGSIEKLAADLTSPDSGTRASAARTLWDLSAKGADRLKPAIPALTEAVLDRNLNVRFMAMTAIKNIGVPAKSAVPALIKALDTFQGGTPALEGPPRYYADARWAAADALAVMGKEAKVAIPALEKALKDPSEDVRTSAAQALKAVRGENH